MRYLNVGDRFDLVESVDFEVFRYSLEVLECIVLLEFGKFIEHIAQMIVQ